MNSDVLLHIASTSEPVAFDVETDSLRWWSGSVGVISFAWNGGSWATREVAVGQSLLQTRMQRGLPCVAHGGSFDLHFLKKRGLQINWRCFHDTLLLARLYNNLADNKLKPLGESLLGIPPSKQNALKEWLRKNEKAFLKEHGRKPNYLDVPDEILLPYAAEDTVLTIKLYHLLYPQTVPSLYERERSLQRIMFEAEEHGVEIDVNLTERKLEAAVREQSLLENKLLSLRPDTNLDSNPQLGTWLYEELGLVPVSHTPGGKPQVNAFNLSANPHPITKMLMARNKRMDSAKFFRAYLELMDGKHRIHPTINTMQARTHRFSCQDPNMQQIPSRKDRFKTREVFISGAGWFVGADFDKQELFIAACEAKETHLLTDLTNDVDVYRAMAAAMLGKPQEQVTSSERQAAKVAVLSMLYGAGAPKVAESFTLNTGKRYTVEQAKQIRDNFKQAYPGLAALMNEMQRQARTVGHVVNRWGRKLYVEPERAYVATDYLVQSSGRDTLADAILNLSQVLPKYGGNIVIPIHDEVISYLPEEPTPDILKEYEEAMANYRFQLPVTAKANKGKCFADLK